MPAGAAEIEPRSWGQFLLKFIISHPAIAGAMPATTRVDHGRENLASARAPLPDAKMRERMVAYIKSV